MATRTKSKMASYYAQRKKYHTAQPHIALVLTEDVPPPLSVFIGSLAPTSVCIYQKPGPMEQHGADSDSLGTAVAWDYSPRRWQSQTMLLFFS